MDLRTNVILKKLAFHQLLRKVLTISSYSLLALAIIIFAFYIFNNPVKKYKIVNDYKKDKGAFKSEKIMTNPTINFQYDDDQVFKIKAKKASHFDQNNVTMYDVKAVGQIGTITAGKVTVGQDGDNITFSQNPVLVIKSYKKK